MENMCHEKAYLLFHQERSKIYLVHVLSTNMQTFVREQAATSYSSLPHRTHLALRSAKLF